MIKVHTNAAVGGNGNKENKCKAWLRLEYISMHNMRLNNRKNNYTEMNGNFLNIQLQCINNFAVNVI